MLLAKPNSIAERDDTCSHRIDGATRDRVWGCGVESNRHSVIIHPLSKQRYDGKEYASAEERKTRTRNTHTCSLLLACLFSVYPGAKTGPRYQHKSGLVDLDPPLLEPGLQHLGSGRLSSTKHDFVLVPPQF